MIQWFLDASFAIALGSPRDRHHAHALELAQRIEAEGIALVTTRPVVLEIGNALAQQRYRSAAVKLLSALEADRTVEIVPLDEELYDHAWALYQDRPDKDWGLTDCVSFVVMQQREIDTALTTDRDFHQAGFRALMMTT